MPKPIKRPPLPEHKTAAVLLLDDWEIKDEKINKINNCRPWTLFIIKP